MESVDLASSRVTACEQADTDFQHPSHLWFHFSLETLSVSLAFPAAALVCAIIMPAGSKK